MKMANSAVATDLLIQDNSWLCRDDGRGNSSRLLSAVTKVAEVALGMAGLKIVNLAFDYLLYPFAICHLGIVGGGALMMLLDIIACFITLRLYDASNSDWLGIEGLKRLRSYDGRSKALQVVSRLLHKSRAMMFIFLSLKFDAFVTTAYFRSGSFNGMNKRDWGIFRTSIVLGNVYWTAACFAGASLFSVHGGL